MFLSDTSEGTVMVMAAAASNRDSVFHSGSWSLPPSFDYDRILIRSSPNMLSPISGGG